MIFKRTLQRELIFYTTAMYAGLILVTLTFTLIRLLTQAVDGKIDPQSVFVLLGFALVNFQALIMSLSVFIGTLLVFSRLWRDSEMIVWQASGLSLRRFMLPTIEFALPMTLLAALFSGLIAPWANQQAYDYKDSFTQRNDISRIAAQQFKESSDGSRVFYVGNTDETNHQVHNIFILERLERLESLEKLENSDTPSTTPTETIVAALQGGVISNKAGDQYLELTQGRRYQVPTIILPALANTLTSLMQFEQYQTLLVEKHNLVAAEDVPLKQRSTMALLSDSTLAARSELIWRLSGPLICLMLAILAVPLSYFNPRSGQSAPLVSAVLIFTVYVNAIGLMQNYLQAEKLSLAMALIAPHGLILLLAIGLLFWRSQWFMQYFGKYYRWVRRMSND